MLLGPLVLGAGLLVLLHSGFSAVHYKGTVAERYGDVALQLPIDVLIEAVLGTLLSIVGGVIGLEKFSPIYSSGQAPLNTLHRMYSRRQDLEPFNAAAPDSDDDDSLQIRRTGR